MRSVIGIIISIVILIGLLIFFILIGLFISNDEESGGYQEKVLIIRFDENETLENIQNLSVKLEEEYPQNTIYYFENLTGYIMVLSIEENDDGFDLSEFIGNNSNLESADLEYINVVTMWNMNDS